METQNTENTEVEVLGIAICGTEVTEENRDEFVWSEHEDEFIHIDEAVDTYDSGWIHDQSEHFYCEISDNCYTDTDYQRQTLCGITAHRFNLDDDSDYIYLEAGRHEGEWVHIDQAQYRESERLWYHVDDEIEPRHPRNEVISSYHDSPTHKDLNYGSIRTDFSIGFEIEKDHFCVNGEELNDRGDHVGSFDLFKGFETDSSCGVEAITNVLPLGGKQSKAREYVFYLFDQAAEIINSPTNSSCGGHINISSKKQGLEDGWDILDKLKHNLAVIYAMYRHRLQNSYCKNNKKMEKGENTKYSPVVVKSGGRIELRLPSRVNNVEQLKNRYDLIFKILYHTFERPVSFEVLLTKLRPNLKRMYKHPNSKEATERQVEKINRLARHFRYYLINDATHPDIEDFIQ